jgi:hypothetical protein
MDADALEKWLDDPAKWLDTDDSTWIEFDEDEIVAWLSADELKEASDKLAQWHFSADFQRIVHDLCKRCRSSEFFNNPHCSFLRDAFVLAEFAYHTKADKVRLVSPSDRWPDGQVKIGGKIENVEVTIALTPGRRMGAEYKSATKCELDPVENWVARAQAIPGDGCVDIALDDGLRGPPACIAASAASISTRIWIWVHQFSFCKHCWAGGRSCRS